MRDELGRHPMPKVVKTILFFVSFVSLAHFSNAIESEAKHANLMTSLALFVSGVFLALAFYGLCSLIVQYQQAEDFKSFLREVKKTVKLDTDDIDQTDQYNSGSS